MEKLNATKKQIVIIKPKQVKIKPKNKFKKQNMFFDVCKQNKARIIILLSVYVLTTALLIIMFANNPYYNFLLKPKIIQNSSSIICLCLPFLSLLFVYYILQLVQSQRQKQLKNLEQKQNRKKVVDISKINIFAKIKHFLSKNDDNFANFLTIFVFLIAIVLFFNLFVLWICAFLSFIVLFMCFAIFLKSKSFYLRLLSVALILNQFCILLAFYFLYLLN